MSSSSTIAKFFRRPSFHLDDRSTTTTTSSDFEFHESDLYPDSSSKPNTKPKLGSMTRKRSAKVVDESCRSVPVSIPYIVSRVGEREGDDGDEFEDGGGSERLAPHEYLARKRGASLSVHEGVGRTLKGRDMRSVRNAALWNTFGFED